MHAGSYLNLGDSPARPWGSWEGGQGCRERTAAQSHMSMRRFFRAQRDEDFSQIQYLTAKCTRLAHDKGTSGSHTLFIYHHTVISTCTVIPVHYLCSYSWNCTAVWTVLCTKLCEIIIMEVVVCCVAGLYLCYSDFVNNRNTFCATSTNRINFKLSEHQQDLFLLLLKLHFFNFTGGSLMIN